MMDRGAVRKTTLRDAGVAAFTGQSPEALLAVLGELNRVALSALGLHEAPMRRNVARKLSFREFASRRPERPIPSH